MARTPKSARAKVVADDVYNARKRFARSGLRNLEKAQSTTGATAAKYRRLAEQDLKAAISTYDPKKKQNYMKEIRQLTEGLNLNLMQQVDQTRRVQGEQLTETVTQSFETLESRLKNPEVRRERQARAILNSPSIGNRIYAGLVDVWKDKATVYDEKEHRFKVDNDKINALLIEYFKVDNLADVLDKLQQTIGEKLYDVSDDRANIYEVVKLLIQSKVADNTLVQ